MVSDPESWLKAPTLIYGPRKAGTTLLLRLLDTSSAVFAFPSETKFKNFQRHPKLLRAKAARRYFAACRHLGLVHPLFDEASYAKRVEAIKQSDGDFTAIVRADAAAMVASLRERRAPPRTFVMKEVGGRSSEGVIAFFRSAFPDGKLILITRDPRFVARALYRARRRAGIRLGPLSLLREALEPVRIAQFQRKLLAHLDIASIQVRYEDLVGGELEPTMRRIAAFLEVPYTDEFGRPTLFGEPTIVATSSRQTNAVFHEDARWEDELEPREVAAIRFAQRVGNRLYGSQASP